jgi:hypothetical protein
MLNNSGCISKHQSDDATPSGNVVLMAAHQPLLGTIIDSTSPCLVLLLAVIHPLNLYSGKLIFGDSK